jgi:hypothetical protein
VFAVNPSFSDKETKIGINMKQTLIPHVTVKLIKSKKKKKVSL